MMVSRVLLVAVSASGMAGCSAPGGGGAEAPDVFAKLGLPPSTSPVRWIESASGTDETREYYQGLIGSSSSVEGGELDISDNAYLVLTRPAGSSSLRYELEVARSKYIKGAPSINS